MIDAKGANMPETELGYRRRNTLRLKNYDYTTSNAYFVTICERHGRSIFGEVIEQVMVLNTLGKIAEQCLIDLGVDRRVQRFRDKKSTETRIAPQNILLAGQFL